MTHAIPEYTIAQLESQPVIDGPSFSSDDAVELGMIAVAVTREWNLSIAVDVELDGYLVFRARLGETGPDNDSWLTGKAAVVREYGESSFLVKTRLIEAVTPFETLDFDHEAMKAHGGSVPLRVNGVLVGTLTTSGEPDAVDHEVASEAVARFLAAR
jgi:uncharacterized protein (UPF0303 family)